MRCRVQPQPWTRITRIWTHEQTRTCTPIISYVNRTAKTRTRTVMLCEFRGSSLHCNNVQTQNHGHWGNAIQHGLGPTSTSLQVNTEYAVKRYSPSPCVLVVFGVCCDGVHERYIMWDGCTDKSKANAPSVRAHRRTTASVVVSKEKNVNILINLWYEFCRHNSHSWFGARGLFCQQDQLECNACPGALAHVHMHTRHSADISR